MKKAAVLEARVAEVRATAAGARAAAGREGVPGKLRLCLRRRR